MHKHDKVFVLFRKGQQPHVLFAKSKMMNFALCLHCAFLELTVQALTAVQYLMWMEERIQSSCDHLISELA